MTRAAAPVGRAPASPGKPASKSGKPAPAKAPKKASTKASKQTSKQASKQAAPASTEPVAPASALPVAPASALPAAAATKPFLRFYHSVALRKKTLDVLDTIEAARDPTVHREALADLVVELTDSGLDYCFTQPLKLAKPGFVIEQTAKIGLAGVQQVIGSVARRIIGRMGGPQLVSVCGSIRQFMR